MAACAQTYLTCRGKDSSFYAQNLCTLAVLAEPTITGEELFATFLDSRSKWMASTGGSLEADKARSFAERERHLTIILRSMNVTVLQAEDIFSVESDFALLKPAFQLKPHFEAELRQFVSTGALQEKMSQWFHIQHKKVRSDRVIVRCSPSCTDATHQPCCYFRSKRKCHRR